MPPSKAGVHNRRWIPDQARDDLSKLWLLELDSAAGVLSLSTDRAVRYALEEMDVGDG